MLARGWVGPCSLGSGDEQCLVTLLVACPHVNALPSPLTRREWDWSEMRRVRKLVRTLLMDESKRMH